MGSEGDSVWLTSGDSSDDSGVFRLLDLAGSRKTLRGVWERQADRRANILAATMENYLACFVS